MKMLDLYKFLAEGNLLLDHNNSSNSQKLEKKLIM